jgi:transcriptional regulator with XRE-family HTH domain
MTLLYHTLYALVNTQFATANLFRGKMLTMDNDFVTWLNRAIQDRGWTPAELSRRSGMHPATISLVIHRERQPGIEFCVGIARALGEQPEYVARLAGLLPPAPPSVQEETELIHRLRRASATDRDAVIRMVRGLASGVTPPRRARLDADPSAPRQPAATTEPLTDAERNAIRRIWDAADDIDRLVLRDILKRLVANHEAGETEGGTMENAHNEENRATTKRRQPSAPICGDG